MRCGRPRFFLAAFACVIPAENAFFGQFPPRAYRRGDEGQPTTATINRELSILRREFSLRRDEDPPLVLHVPKTPARGGQR